jgi:hypothetical protein
MGKHIRSFSNTNQQPSNIIQRNECRPPHRKRTQKTTKPSQQKQRNNNFEIRGRARKKITFAKATGQKIKRRLKSSKNIQKDT